MDPTFDYTQLGYNNRLQATDSLAAANENFTTGTEFTANTEGNAVTNYNVRNISADKISAGTIVVSMNIGGANITIDGSAQQILVSDGTTNRIIIGYLAGGYVLVG